MFLPQIRDPLEGELPLLTWNFIPYFSARSRLFGLKTFSVEEEGFFTWASLLPSSVVESTLGKC